MWFIGVEVEQETSAPPPEKNPGSAPARTKENRLDQIQKALWRKLEPLFSRNNEKRFTLQKRSKKMRLHQRANPADQNTITTKSLRRPPSSHTVRENP